MRTIDLHVHSSCSDGTLSPEEVVRHAGECGLAAIALTDHDNTDGVVGALAAGVLYNVEVIPGIEFATEHLGQDIHVVALEPDWTDPAFQAQVADYQEERFRRNRKMIERMASDGIDISYEKMLEAFGETVWNRANFGRYLIDHGYAVDMEEAYRVYVGEDCPYYVPRKKVSPMEVTRLIRQFHGIPVLAHPFQYRFTEAELEELVEKMCAEGLIGIEAYYSTHSEEQTEYVLDLAAKYDLLPSGGSDFHGANKPTIALGTGKNNLNIPYEIIENLRQRKRMIESAAE